MIAAAGLPVDSLVHPSSGRPPLRKSAKTTDPQARRSGWRSGATPTPSSCCTRTTRSSMWSGSRLSSASGTCSRGGRPAWTTDGGAAALQCWSFFLRIFCFAVAFSSSCPAPPPPLSLWHADSIQQQRSPLSSRSSLRLRQLPPPVSSLPPSSLRCCSRPSSQHGPRYSAAQQRRRARLSPLRRNPEAPPARQQRRRPPGAGVAPAAPGGDSEA